MAVTTRALRPSHLSLGVSDLAVSERFYRDVLGFEPRREDGEIFIELPDFLIVLTESPPAGRSKFHFGFKVGSNSEVDAWARRAKEHGARVELPHDRGGGRAVFLNDPDDYIIEIYSE